MTLFYSYLRINIYNHRAPALTVPSYSETYFAIKVWLSRAFGAADWLDIIARINRSTGRNDLVER